MMRTGTASFGNSGMIALSTGEARLPKEDTPDKHAHGGDIELTVGRNHWGDGGDVLLRAGLTTADASEGGRIRMQHLEHEVQRQVRLSRTGGSSQVHPLLSPPRSQASEMSERVRCAC